MKREKDDAGKWFMPVVYAVFIYFIWEVTGTFVSYVIGKITRGLVFSLYSTYIVMFLNEIITFAILYLFFHKKVCLVRRAKGDSSLLVVSGMILFPLIQICDDVITILNGKRIFSILSGKGMLFFMICFIACLSTGLLEEYVWRGIVLNVFLKAWGKKKEGVYASVLMSSVCFGACHYMNLLAGQDFISTSQQVISATCMGVFLSALFLNTNHLVFPVLVHGLCNFSNFFMNEILGWNYSVWEYDDILQWILAIGYLIVGLYFVHRYEKVYDF
ncbi:MAG: lysostaphin resistance A-like protein [Faecalimonas sp.]